MLEIRSIPAFSDNYIWLGINHRTKTAFVVDPGNATPVLEFLEQNNLNLEVIFITHKHADHIGGITILHEKFKNIKIYGHAEEKIPNITHVVTEGSLIKLENWSLTFKTLHIPGHTLGHVAYYSAPNLFCGDTLFAGGCGRVFEGTFEQMYLSLNKLSKLPEDTLVYCAHEYTLANLNFAKHVESNNQLIDERILRVKKLRGNNFPSIPSTIHEEKETNPFLRCSSQEIINAVETKIQRPTTNIIDVFQELRLWKNIYQ